MNHWDSTIFLDSDLLLAIVFVVVRRVHGKQVGTALHTMKEHCCSHKHESHKLYATTTVVSAAP